MNEAEMISFLRVPEMMAAAAAEAELAVKQGTGHAGAAWNLGMGGAIAQAQLALALRLPFIGFAFCQILGSRQILALKGIDLIRMGGSPFQRLRQARATIEEIRLAATRCPILGGFCEMAVQAQQIESDRIQLPPKVIHLE